MAVSDQLASDQKRRIIRIREIGHVLVTARGTVEHAIDKGDIAIFLIGSVLYVDIDEVMAVLRPKVRYFSTLLEKHPAIYTWPDDFDLGKPHYVSPTSAKADLFSAA